MNIQEELKGWANKNQILFTNVDNNVIFYGDAEDFLIFEKLPDVKILLVDSYNVLFEIHVGDDVNGNPETISSNFVIVDNDDNSMTPLNEGLDDLLSDKSSKRPTLDNIMKGKINKKKRKIKIDDVIDSSNTEFNVRTPKEAAFQQEVEEKIAKKKPNRNETIINTDVDKIKLATNEKLKELERNKAVEKANIESRKNAERIAEREAKIKARKNSNSDDIVLHKPLANQENDLVLKSIERKNKFDISKKRSALPQPKDEKDIILRNSEIKKDFEIFSDKLLPDDIDYIEIEKELNDTLNTIPDMKPDDFTGIDIIKSPKKSSKLGYYKTKVAISTKGIPKQINEIASYVKKHTKGMIKPRVVDLRVINNANKNQLKNHNHKLSKYTILFKPDPTKFKIKKYNRIMLSIPSNYGTTGNILVFMQDSRQTEILEITSKDFPNIQVFNEFLGDRIVEYYFSGIDVTLTKLALRTENNPLMEIITIALMTNEYKAKPYIENNHVYEVDFISKVSENNWLYVKVTENLDGKYMIFAKNTIDENWEFQLTKSSIVFNSVKKNILNILSTAFAKNWSKLLNINTEEENIYYQLGKLTHGKLKHALIYLDTFGEENPELGLKIVDTLNKSVTESRIENAYDAEAIVGKTKFVNYFVLLYLGYHVEAGDDRRGRQYIDNKEYYDKYNVKDKRPYDERNRTIMAYGESQRNYNARPYLFQLEYVVGNKKHLYVTDNFDELLKSTGILTDSPSFPQSKF